VMRNLVYALLEEFVWRFACRANDQGSYGSAAHSPWSLNRYLRIVQVEFSKREAVRYTARDDARDWAAMVSSGASRECTKSTWQSLTCSAENLSEHLATDFRAGT
jgi:hypothetical protein